MKISLGITQFSWSRGAVIQSAQNIPLAFKQPHLIDHLKNTFCFHAKFTAAGLGSLCRTPGPVGPRFLLRNIGNNVPLLLTTRSFMRRFNNS